LDVEGYECAAVAGGIETIKKYRPYIWVEFFISGIDAIKQTLSAVPDYEFFKMDPQNILCMPKESRSRIDFFNVEQC
jgi:hypothetical protein